MPLPSEAQSKIEVRAFWTWRDSENLIGPSIPDIAPLLSRPALDVLPGRQYFGSAGLSQGVSA
jgi:hypothetical protein